MTNLAFYELGHHKGKSLLEFTSHSLYISIFPFPQILYNKTLYIHIDIEAINNDHKAYASADMRDALFTLVFFFSSFFTFWSLNLFQFLSYHLVPPHIFANVGAGLLGFSTLSLSIKVKTNHLSYLNSSSFIIISFSSIIYSLYLADFMRLLPIFPLESNNWVYFVIYLNSLTFILNS